MKKTLELFSPMILIEIFDEGSINSNHHNAHDYLTHIGYSKYFIDDLAIYQVKTPTRIGKTIFTENKCLKTSILEKVSKA